MGVEMHCDVRGGGRGKGVTDYWCLEASVQPVI